MSLTRASRLTFPAGSGGSGGGFRRTLEGATASERVRAPATPPWFVAEGVCGRDVRPSRRAVTVREGRDCHRRLCRGHLLRRRPLAVDPRARTAIKISSLDNVVEAAEVIGIDDQVEVGSL